MRILHAFKVYRPDVEGGVPEVIGILAGSALPNVEHKVLVARHFGLGRDFEVDGVRVISIASFGNVFSMPIAPRFPFALAHAAKQSDLLALHAPFPLNDIGIGLGIPARVGLVIHWHSDIMGRRVLVRMIAPLIRKALTRADRIIVSSSRIISLSPFLKDHLDKCVVIPFGVDPDYWGRLNEHEQLEVERLRARHPRLVVAVGRLVHYKGFDVLVRALQKVDATAIIIGDGPLASSLRRLAAQLGVAERLIFAGNASRDRVRLYLHAARAFAFPSKTSAETFGIAQLQAMAAGLPIINTALPTGVSLVARHRQESLTIPPNDPSALAEAIELLISDRALAEELGRAGRHRVNEQYHYQSFLRQVHRVYEEVHAHRCSLPNHFFGSTG